MSAGRGSIKLKVPCDNPDAVDAIRDAVLSRSYVSLGSRRTSSPHEFYRYPARFPPAFARAAIEAFTSIGDLVLDPFVGGGTTLVEARLLGRPAIGADLNPLAVFVSRVKARPLRAAPLDAVEDWATSLSRRLGGMPRPVALEEWVEAGYLRNVDGADTREIRTTLAKVVEDLDTIQGGTARDFARCVTLRTAQWALDMRSEIPSASEFLNVVEAVGIDMTTAARAYARDVRKADALYELGSLSRRSRVVAQRLPGLTERLGVIPTPKLILTSPPYPGVYVNYHRWKVRGRRETPAPFWLANRLDGNGLAYYTMSARADRSLAKYFQQLRAAFRDVRSLCDGNTIVAQMVGFHDPAHDLPRYLKAMGEAGFGEIRFATAATADDGRLWRQVPNRRWWAVNAGNMHTAVEVVLFHRAT